MLKIFQGLYFRKNKKVTQKGKTKLNVSLKHTQELIWKLKAFMENFPQLVPLVLPARRARGAKREEEYE